MQQLWGNNAILKKNINTEWDISAVMKKKKVNVPLHHKIIHHIQKYHKLRKWKESGLPSWKEKWGHFNEEYLDGLEHFVEWAIPWLVLLLLFIILGENSAALNFFHWAWVDKVTGFFHHNEETIAIIDHIIISFFIVDLYFNFFKKKTIMGFLRTSILDIIAVAPMGLIFDLAGIAETQKAIHVTAETEKGVAKLARTEKIIAKMPRLVRLYRIGGLFKKKKH